MADASISDGTMTGQDGPENKNPKEEKQASE